MKTPRLRTNALRISHLLPVEDISFASSGQKHAVFPPKSPHFQQLLLSSGDPNRSVHIRSSRIQDLRCPSSRPWAEQLIKHRSVVCEMFIRIRLFCFNEGADRSSALRLHAPESPALARRRLGSWILIRSCYTRSETFQLDGALWNINTKHADVGISIILLCNISIMFIFLTLPRCVKTWLLDILLSYYCNFLYYYIILIWYYSRYK